MKNKITLIITSLLISTSCTTKEISPINQNNYNKAADFALASLKSTTCMGEIDAIFFKAGYKEVDKNGILSFRGNNANTNCKEDDFKIKLERYCISKGGHYDGDWCVRDDEPIFHISGFDIQESASTADSFEWKRSARTILGYLSNKDINNEKEKTKNEIETIKKTKENRSNYKKNFKIGDHVCRYDEKYELDSIIYSGYIEGKTEEKIKIVLTWHGGKDLTIKDWVQGEFKWEPPKKWFNCETK